MRALFNEETGSFRKMIPKDWTLKAIKKVRIICVGIIGHFKLKIPVKRKMSKKLIW